MQIAAISQLMQRKAILYSAVSTGLLLIGLVSGAVVNAKGWLPFGGDNVRVPIYLASNPGMTDQVTINTGLAPVARAVTPAVVTVQISSRARQQQFQFFDDPIWPFSPDPFRDFFHRGLPDDDDRQTPRRQSPAPRQSPENRRRLIPSGLGSGVIVSPDGYILTNNHVVDGADKVEVTMNDRRSFTAKIIGTDPPSDIAVLKIDGGGFPTIPFGDSNKAEVGDVVLAVGNPLGVGQTVTMGIISARGRSTRAGLGSGSYEDFLQTDAAINRGNSGGALVNLKGELIGIPSQILSQTGSNIGIGFAIPSEMARAVMDQLLKGGKVHRGKLGVMVSDLTQDLAAHFNYKNTQGALVQEVEPGQPADRAGVKPGDIITEFEGRRIDDSSRLRNLVAQTAPESSVKFKIWRDGTERELTARLTEVEVKDAIGAGKGQSSPAASALAGLSVESLTPDMARRLNISPTAHGVVITEIDAESSAAEAGLQRGDVIEEVNRQPISNASEFDAAVRKADKRDILLRIRRADGARFIVVRPRQ